MDLREMLKTPSKAKKAAQFMILTRQTKIKVLGSSGKVRDQKNRQDGAWPANGESKV